jgi:hypothetical protein
MKIPKKIIISALLLMLLIIFFMKYKPSAHEGISNAKVEIRDINDPAEKKSLLKITDSHWLPHFLEAESTNQWNELLEKILAKKIPQRTPTEGIELLFAEWSRFDSQSALAAALALDNGQYKICALRACIPNMYRDESFFHDVMLSLTDSEQSKFRYDYVIAVATLDLTQCIDICNAMADDKNTETKRSVVDAMIAEVFERGSFEDIKKLLTHQDFALRQKKDLAYRMSSMNRQGFEIHSLINTVKEPDLVNVLQSKFFEIANANELKQFLEEKPQFFRDHPDQSVKIMQRDAKYCLNLIKNNTIDLSRMPWKNIDSLCCAAATINYKYADVVFHQIPESEENKSRCAEHIAACLIYRNVDHAGNWIKSMPASKHRDAALDPLLDFYRKNDKIELFEEWSQLRGGY